MSDFQKEAHEMLGGYLRRDKAIECLMSFNITAEDVYHTITHVKHGVSGLYSFKDIARGSTRSVHSQAEGCSLEVHPMHHNMENQLSVLAEEYVDRFSFDNDVVSDEDDLEALLKLGKNASIPAYPFQERLSQLFRKLNDAHTTYMNPYGIFAAKSYFYDTIDKWSMEFSGTPLKLSVDGHPPAVYKEGSYEKKKVTKVKTYQTIEKLDTSTMEDKEVVDVKEWDPTEFLLHEAENEGNYKSQGGRLNSLLNVWGAGKHAGKFSTMTRSIPPWFKIGLEFESGAEEEYELIVEFFILDVSVAQKITETNNRWTLVKQWLDANFQLQGHEQKAAFQELKGKLASLHLDNPFEGIVPELAAPRLRSLDGSLKQDASAQAIQRQLKDAVLVRPEEYQRWSAEYQASIAAGASDRATSPEVQDGGPALRGRRRLWWDGDDVQELGRWPAPESTLAPMMIIYYIHSTKTAVFKMTGFMPPAMDVKTIYRCFASMIHLYQHLWKESGSDRIILDLADNGGGMVDLANMLVMLFAPDRKTSAELCTSYSVRINSFWKKWMDSFGGRWKETIAAAEKMDPKALLERFMKLKSVKDLEAATELAVPVSAEFWKLMQQVEDMETDPKFAGNEAAKLNEQRSLILHALRNRGLYFVGPGGAGFVGQDGLGEGWYPFTGDMINPENGERFDPPMEPYWNLKEKSWGGVTGNYTSEYIMSCALPFTQEFIQDLERAYLPWGVTVRSAKHKWREVSILTNGLCGSACALVQSRLQFGEGATVFTYGGDPTERSMPMDSAAFAGGNVEDFKQFWPMVLYSAVVGDIIHGEWTAIGQRLREPGAAERHYAKTLVLPLPTQAMTRFNFNMMFVKEMGPGALPREWYIMPGHKNYRVWIPTSITDIKTWKPLQQLYTRVAREDWQKLRNEDSTTACGNRPKLPPRSHSGGGYDDHPDWNEPGHHHGYGGYLTVIAIGLVVLGVGYFIYTSSQTGVRPGDAAGSRAGEVARA
eukprot:CAMPEP_0178379686 /NCGR_PEP_ID=MMETSP0689_2-20121128/5074_1 /TAXON_ID=160604 /ORGANISM="Amphidinium massartii, Strain CS-259" /LENGTH=992 /DNA_ID=CAMNT_0019999803 /DNA_START=58 /DNA_END=3032 /DNA_ORIENTATION=-